MPTLCTRWRRSLSSLKRVLSFAARMTIQPRTHRGCQRPVAVFRATELDAGRRASGTSTVLALLATKCRQQALRRHSRDELVGANDCDREGRRREVHEVGKLEIDVGDLFSIFLALGLKPVVDVSPIIQPLKGNPPKI